MQSLISNSDCTQRNRLHAENGELVANAVRHVRNNSSRACQYDIAELEQIGHVALLEAAERNRDDVTFKGYAWTCVVGTIRRFVAKMHMGTNHRELEVEGVQVRVLTNISQMGHLERLIPPSGGNAHWVRDAVGKPPLAVCSMFASAGYAGSSRAQSLRLLRRVSGMMP